MKTFNYVVVALAVVAVGCSSAPEESAASSTEPLAEFCNTNPQRGRDVTTYKVALDMPHGHGGQIKAGTYVMIARTIFTGRGGETGRADGPYNVTITNDANPDGSPNGNSQLVIHAPVLPNGYVMQPGEQFHANSWYKTPGGNTFVSQHTCPDQFVVPFSEYTAFDGLWLIYDFVNSQVWTLKKID